ncbi:ParB/RepB/Spo0J family partition protein [Viridibacillus sp. FSL R5-0477]|uniref:Stage 0 sporulation protein J n=1 Tax=Viridibacillus arenosi FSL R5-213 TaxID=1227360 RepID=W4F8F3_9BACL|nr:MULTISPECIES: ParB/RepB/Spo0J family partition protein [Viridibacillus]ETT88529.1 stage 0 sporulation protein J [Viridibacillus arenosi FSL R5-213]OMC81088.1 chromosome partitioning protein ParB [Viridibacillus sp. FSL H8-0123]OMC85160.1 chromosome partitioning protein ParB [Viridibacillus sp. FSL H7-0596]OMC90150.1 chromosome partitioning protein ParB [Viridibacillus arenosi]
MAKGLGKGINALFPGESLSSNETIEHLALTDLRANPYQPRKIFDESAIEELAISIKEHGVLQPIIARKRVNFYEIVVGERRFRASKLAGLTEIPVVVREMDDQQMMELAILENLQREDLTPIEEAEAYTNLMDNLNLTQEQLAARLGKSRPHIANHVRLLALPEDVRILLSEGKITMGHGRALLGLKRRKLISQVTEKVLTQHLNVRQLEALVQSMNDNVSRETKKKVKKDIFIAEKESQLRDYFGTNVTIKESKNKGKIEIEFFSADDLERILELLED